MALNPGQIEKSERRLGTGGYGKRGAKATKKNEYNRKMRRLPIGEEYKIGKYKGYN